MRRGEIRLVSSYRLSKGLSQFLAHAFDYLVKTNSIFPHFVTIKNRSLPPQISSKHRLASLFRQRSFVSMIESVARKD